MTKQSNPARAAWAMIGKVALTLAAAGVLSFLLSLAVVKVGIARDPSLKGLAIAEVMADPWVVLGLQWVQMAAFVAAVVLMYYIFERRRSWKLGLPIEGCLPRLAEGLVLGFVLITVSGLLIWVFGGVQVIGSAWTPGLGGKLLAGLLLFAGVAFNEELFARGYVQGLITARFGPVWGIALSTMPFALMHAFNPGVWDSPVPMVNLYLAGLLLALSREVSGSLWMPIGLHLFWNYFQGYVYGFKVSGLSISSWLQLEQTGRPLLSGGAFGAEGSLLTSVVLLAGIVLLAARYPYRRTRPASGGEAKEEGTTL